MILRDLLNKLGTYSRSNMFKYKRKTFMYNLYTLNKTFFFKYSLIEPINKKLKSYKNIKYLYRILYQQYMIYIFISVLPIFKMCKFILNGMFENKNDQLKCYPDTSKIATNTV